MVYDELRELAAARMAPEDPGQTLQATALVHKAILRCVSEALKHLPLPIGRARGILLGFVAKPSLPEGVGRIPSATTSC